MKSEDMLNPRKLIIGLQGDLDAKLGDRAPRIVNGGFEVSMAGGDDQWTETFTVLVDRGDPEPLKVTYSVPAGDEAYDTILKALIELARP